MKPTIEHHVVSLSLAKELKANNFPQEGNFWWVHYRKWSKLEDKWKDWWELRAKDQWFPSDEVVEYCIASFASELMERLPDVQLCKFGEGDKRYAIAYNEGTEKDKRLVDFNFCNALAKMWLYLKKEGLL